jgi:molybdopterin converting factor small subunit
MEIHVRLYGVLREKLPANEHGRAVLELPDGATVSDVLSELDVTGHFHVSVNEEMVEDRQTELRDGDQVDVLPPTAGGCSWRG